MIQIRDYWWMVTTRFFGWAWEHVLESAAIGIAVFLIGSWIQYQASGVFPSLKQSRAEFMASAAQVLIYGFSAVIVTVAVLFVLSLVIIPPKIHSEQLVGLQRARVDLENATATIKERDAEIQSRKPKLSGTIRNMFTTTISSEQHQHAFPMAAFHVAVRNSGSPSIAEHWSVRAQMPDGRTINGMPLFFGQVVPHLPDNISVSHRAVFEGGDSSIFKKTSEPIGTGAVLRGWATFAFPGESLGEAFKVGTIHKHEMFAVSFEDITGEKIQCAFDPRMDNMDVLPPGMTPVFEGDF